MALTRAFLKSLGLEEDKVSAIIEAHSETVEGLKAEKEKIQKEMEEAGTGWKKKFDDLTAEFDAYKTQQTEKETRSAKESAFTQLLKDAGVSEKRIASVLKVSDIGSLKLNKDGTLSGAEELTKTIKTEWADFIQLPKQKGATVDNPPKPSGGTPQITKEEFAKMGYQSRLQLKQESPEVYNELVNNK